MTGSRPPVARVAVDVGGTFTDLVALSNGRVHVVKVPSTPDQSDGFLEAVERASSAGFEADEVLHGTTVATNAVIERRGARVALLATEGFRHLLHLGRQNRPSLYDLASRPPQPLVALEDCFGVPERTGPDGAVIRPLDRAALEAQVAGLAGRVDAVAVCLLHAYAGDDHERAVLQILAEALPGVDAVASSQVLPEFREFERASTTVLDAYVRPATAAYLKRLDTRLGGRPFRVMRSGGGLRDAAECARHPVHLLYSGPAAGVLAAAYVARSAGEEHVVTLDLGGTSADVALVEESRPLVAEEAELEGLPFRTPCIDVISVGAGGGSVAWVDDGGALRVGPRSAGSQPGPACYGRGGTEPTVTDAHVVLGHLPDGSLAGGALSLDRDRAEAVLAGIGGRLGVDASEAARGVLMVARATMTRAIRSVSIERGKDVRKYALVAFGGAGPLHACAVARELGIGRVVVPPSPGALAALGLLVARRRADASRSLLIEATEDGAAGLEAVLRDLASRVTGELELEGVAPGECELIHEVDCRYMGQSHELRVAARLPVRAGELIASFGRVHEERYGFARPSGRVELVTARATALGPQPVVPLRAAAADGPPEPRAADAEGRRVDVYDRTRLPAGFEIAGPAILVELDSTTLVEEGCRAVVHETGSVLIDVGGAP